MKAWRHLILPLLLAGCAVGPDYRRPATPSGAAAEAGFVTPTGPLTTAAPPPGRWWALYRDPELDRLVADAFRANADLRQAVARLERARAVLAEARSDRLPATTITGGATYGRQSAQDRAAGGAGGDASGGDGARMIYSAGFDVSYEVDLFGRIRRSIEAARADLAAEAAAADFVRVTVAAETTRAYTGACAGGAQLLVAREGLRIAQAQLDLARQQARLGALPEVELDRLSVVVDQAAAVIPPLENGRRASLFNLALLTGRAPAEVDAVADRCARVPAPAGAIPVGDGRALLARRPDVREAERRLAAATARIGVATADLYPTITLGGSVTASGPSLGDAVSRRGVGFGIGPLLNWFFPNVAAARARIGQAEATTRGGLAAFDGVVLTALNETERALTAYATETDRNAALRRAALGQERAFGVLQASARLGAAAPIDVLDAERVLITARNQLAASDALLADRRVDLFRALGGGWEGGPAASSGGER